MKKLPIFLALDVDNEKTALDFAHKLSGRILGFKVGPRLYFRSGKGLIQNLSRLGEVFLDFKFYDIPSTMEAGVRAGFEQGARHLTVHASAGVEALSRTAQVEKDFPDCRVLAVTVLTSQSDASSNSVSVLDHVLHLAENVQQSGLSGLVASVQEVQKLREKYPHFFIVTPGIRLSPIKGDDQKRAGSPSEALSLGASALVMGRSLLNAPDPIKAVENIAESLVKD